MIVGLSLSSPEWSPSRNRVSPSSLWSHCRSSQKCSLPWGHGIVAPSGHDGGGGGGGGGGGDEERVGGREERGREGGRPGRGGEGRKGREGWGLFISGAH